MVPPRSPSLAWARAEDLLSPWRSPDFSSVPSATTTTATSTAKTTGYCGAESKTHANAQQVGKQHPNHLFPLACPKHDCVWIKHDQTKPHISWWTSLTQIQEKNSNTSWTNPWLWLVSTVVSPFCFVDLIIFLAEFQLKKTVIMWLAIHTSSFQGHHAVRSQHNSLFE